jgi:26S proteasome regulatory subunit N5
MDIDLVEEKLKELSLEDVQGIKNLKLQDAISELNQLEKKYRVAGDAISIGRILVTIAELYFECSKFTELNDSIIAFTTKKHLQSEHAIGAMIRKCNEYTDIMEDRSTKMKLLETLKMVTDGRLFVEIERAKICMKLAIMKREDDDIEGAIKTIEDLKIDTMTSLDRKERIEIVLELMELLLESKEFIKCLIVAKKINKQTIDQIYEFEALKIRFYKLMIEIDKSENYLNTSRHYQAILSTEKVKEDLEESQKMLKFAIVYCILAPFDNEKSDMMARLNKNQLISKIPLYQELLAEFTTIELINWYSMKAKFKAELLSLGIFDVATQEGLKLWKDFRTATIEHNIKVFATYYKRAYLSHISEFLDINIDETEKFLCNLIIKKSISAKIDRLTGIVVFNHSPFFVANEKPTDCEQERNTLEVWLQQISTLMKLIDKTSHLINKEESAL